MKNEYDKNQPKRFFQENRQGKSLIRQVKYSPKNKISCLDMPFCNQTSENMEKRK
ncbi:hypothetical protein J7K27_10325 [Candidatus Bathyarchaeota archaeon]|nr:hypothetical protein [Candidatus Bathyarchaeota archaeon]